MNSMNADPFRAARPRLVCRIVRLWCAIVSERRPNHARSCPECQAYFQAGERLERALRCDAVELQSQGHASPPDFEQQILRAVRTSASMAGRARPGLSIPAWIMGVIGTAAATAAVVLWLGLEPPSNQQAQLADASTAEDAAVIVQTVESLSAGLVGSLIPSAGELVAENPLQRELGAVYSDVRSALDFLALNFLPGARVDPAPDQARRI